jgi:glucose-1-phosphate cytidylyltransferase
MNILTEVNMKAVILAGGYGTRISEESSVRPKPMVEIGGKPILWHIMKIYSVYGIDNFIICCGYKGNVIKEYFANYRLHMSDVTFDLRNGAIEIHCSSIEPWRITLVDTGDGTMTGGRIKRVARYIDDETFCLTYGDGLSNVNIGQLIAFHHEQGKLVTLTAVQPRGRFGNFVLEHGRNTIRSFQEKPEHGDGRGSWINGGFFVVEPKAIAYIEGEQTIWEREPLERLSEEGQLAAFRHQGFWQPMDTLRDKYVLEELWQSAAAPWKIW